MKKDKQNKKKRKALPIILIVLGSLLALVAGVFLYGYLKLGSMRRGSVPIVPAPVDVGNVTAEPVDLVPVENPDELDLSEDYDPEIDPADFGNDDIFRRDAIDENVVNILLLGNDARDEFDHGRTDTMLLLSYNRQTREAKLISFLRDTWIYIPGRDKWNRINTAYRFGGIGLAINTLNYNFDLDIQNYVRVDFNAMKAIVDSIGGIDIELTEREVEYINNGVSEKLPVHAGWHHLNGAQTLWHARNRSIGGDGDWSRTRRQRNVLNAILNRLKKERNVSSLISILYTMIDHVETNMNPSQIVSLGVDVIFGGSFSLKDRALPFEGTWEYAWEGRMAVIHIDIRANRNKLHEYLYGSID